MTKMQRLQWENQKMKDALGKINAMCSMTDDERKEYLKQFEYEGAQFLSMNIAMRK